MTVSDALRHGFLDRGRKHFCNAHTGEVCNLDEALRNGWIIIKSNYDRSKGKSGLSFRGLLSAVSFMYSVQVFIRPSCFTTVDKTVVLFRNSLIFKREQRLTNVLL